MQSAKQLARFGIFYLEEAIITLLAEELEGLNPIQISKALGISAYVIPPTDEAMAYAVVHSVLEKLKRESRVIGFEQSRWKLTEREASLRREYPL